MRDRFRRCAMPRRKASGRDRRCRCAAVAAALFALCAIAAPTQAAPRGEVRIGIGFGLAFLPIYICQDLKLVEKYAKGQHLDIDATYQRFLDAGSVEEAIESGTIDIGPYGVAPLLAASEQPTKRQILAVSGITTLPLTLLTNRRSVHGIADLGPGDRIAIPTPTAPQLYFLQIASEKLFGKYDRLADQLTFISHGAALAALISGAGTVTAYFSSPPYTQIALKDARIHSILRSEDLIGGKASFLVLGARKSYVEAHARVAEAVAKAIDEAARIIHDDPARAARIYLTHEPSKALNEADIEAVLRQDKDEFGSAVQGFKVLADFLSRHGELKSPLKSWRDIVAPALLNSPGS
jgi:ABC-type nitrate/sulfonate/bicarbonate transport system substrate-binding protein